jgi:two-component sensor histidine kinase
MEELDALVWSAERLRTASNAAGVALWSWNVDTNEVSMDEHGYVLWGVERAGPLTFKKLSLHVYPPDRDKMENMIEATRVKPGPYEIDFRILHGDEMRWITARGLGADEGIVGRIMFGIFFDVTERKLAEEARDMLATEMSHRVKNLFAIVSSLIAIAARSATTTKEMARDLTRRLASLGGAHDLIRRDAKPGENKTAFLEDLFAAFLAPYDTKGTVGDRVRVSLPKVRVGETSVTALALIVHELATNSIKYGSLSAADGSLDVTLGSDDNREISVVWTELGGPPVSTPAGPGGFGSTLVSRSVTGQLAGFITFDWLPQGVVITLRLNKAALAD